MASTAHLFILAALAGPWLAQAKVFEVTWTIPENGLILPSVSTAKCGDTIRFRCPPSAKHGIYRMSSNNHNGSCPSSFTTAADGMVLAAPVKGCDFNLTLGADPDFFVTSHAAGDCEANLKMNVHTVCIGGGASVSASDVLGKPRIGSLPGATLGMAGGLGRLSLEAGEQTGQQSLSLASQRPQHTLGGASQGLRPQQGGGSNGAAASSVQLLLSFAAGVASLSAILL